MPEIIYTIKIIFCRCYETDVLKRPVHPPALSALIIKLATSDDGESALGASHARDLAIRARVGGGGGNGESREERNARL